MAKKAKTPEEIQRAKTAAMIDRLRAEAVEPRAEDGWMKTTEFAKQSELSRRATLVWLHRQKDLGRMESTTYKTELHWRAI